MSLIRKHNEGMLQAALNYIPFIGGAKYPVEVFVWKKRGGNQWRTYKDKGERIINDDETSKYVLKNEGVETPPYDYDRIQTFDDQDFLFVVSPAKGRYIPVKPKAFNQDEIEDLDPDEVPEGAMLPDMGGAEWDQFNAAVSAKAEHDWKENSWLTSEQKMMLIGGFAIFLMLIGLGFGYMKAMEGQAEVAKQSTEAARQLAETCKQVIQNNAQ